MSQKGVSFHVFPFWVTVVEWTTQEIDVFMSAEQNPTEEDRVFIRMMIDNGLQDAWPAENLTNADFHDTITVFACQGLMYFFASGPIL